MKEAPKEYAFGAILLVWQMIVCCSIHLALPLGELAVRRTD